MKKIQEQIKGKDYWRSLDQLADTPEFKEFLYREFPENASEMTNPVTRRKFLGLMGASIALAGLTSCRRPVEKIVPYVKAPEDIIPGIPQFYATTVAYGAHNYGVLIESNEGRPTKIEGNEMHPSSLGKTNIFMQAEMLNMFDPDRAQEITQNGIEKSWDEFVEFWKGKYSAFLESQGEGLAVLSGEFASPTLYRLYTTFKKTFPKALWLVDEPINYSNLYSGLQTATGKSVRPSYAFDKAKVVLSIDNDFLGNTPEAVTNNYTFANARRVKSEKDKMNRLYMVESTFTITGGMADHRQRLSQEKIEAFVNELAAELNIAGINTKPQKSGINSPWLKALAKDLKTNTGSSLVIAGYKQSPAIHALVYAINTALNNNGKTVNYYTNDFAVLASSQGQLSSILKINKVKTFVAIDYNPVYTNSSDTELVDTIKNLETFVSYSSRVDETATLAQWHVPTSHFLETWGDAVSIDGTASVVQPLIEPIYHSIQAVEFFDLLATGKKERPYDLVRATWKEFLGTGFENTWLHVLHDGVWDEKKYAKIVTGINISAINDLLQTANITIPELSKENLQVVFHPSNSVYDGRFANNGWMMEVPDPVTKISWDNAALISPKTALELGVQTQDKVILSVNGKDMEIVVSVLPGQADNVVSLELGFGRTKAGRIGNGTGFNVYPLKPGSSTHYSNGAKITKTGETYLLSNTQDHNSMEGRPLIREATIEKYREEPNFAPEMVEMPALRSLWTERSYTEGYQWGMSIDLNVCSSCNACVIACQSENNIPIVGREQVRNGREMHWLRLDRYFAGDVNDPEMVYQPVACQQCENAPCEQVCPVQATQHDKEGLNAMIYNRCIGTRYCSNNCPYKVRRFNFFNYTYQYGEMQKMAQNPDVTVRSRGVMEKCTYCTQRINETKIKAKLEERLVKDGEIRTACQQACPTEAIVFGNINDPDSQVSQLKKQNRTYAMLGELNLKPRTTFLAKLRNPNPEIEKLIEQVS